MSQLVFVPMTVQQAADLRAGADLGERAGCAATTALSRAVGSDAVTEEVEYAALSYAGDLARAAHPRAPRLVLAADVSAAQVSDRATDMGEVRVTGLRWTQVQSLFADDPSGPADGDDDLLWFALTELDHLG